jgi:hypothetical protein
MARLMMLRASRLRESWMASSDNRSPRAEKLRPGLIFAKLHKLADNETFHNMRSVLVATSLPFPLPSPVKRMTTAGSGLWAPDPAVVHGRGSGKIPLSSQPFNPQRLFNWNLSPRDKIIRAGMFLDI